MAPAGFEAARVFWMRRGRETEREREKGFGKNSEREKQRLWEEE